MRLSFRKALTGLFAAAFATTVTLAISQPAQAIPNGCAVSHNGPVGTAYCDVDRIVFWVITQCDKPFAFDYEVYGQAELGGKGVASRAKCRDNNRAYGSDVYAEVA
jgi:hypothetical protein